MAFNLASILRRTGTRRKSFTLKAIYPTNSQFLTLGGILVKIPKLWHEDADKILDAYERTLQERGARRDAALRDSPQDIDAQITETEQKAGGLIVQVSPEIRSYVGQVEEWHRRKFTSSVLSATGVDIKTLLNPEGDTVDDFTRSIIALVRNVDDATRNRISGIVFRGLQEETPRREIARQITEATNIERKRALRIAVDQTTKLAARLDQARQEEAGIEEYVWLHSHKKNPRPTHVARDGKIFKWSQPPADGPPGTQPFCGCKARAHINLDD